MTYEGALLLRRLLQAEIDELLRDRREVIRAGFDEDVPELNRQIAAVRYVHEEVERVIHDKRGSGAWPAGDRHS